MKEYVLSIVSAAIICAVGQLLLRKNSATGRIAYLLSGILIAVTVMAPLGEISFSNVAKYCDNISIDAQKYVNIGTSFAENQMYDIIKSQSEAYILDKANRMGLQIAVEVELDGRNGNIPCEVIVSGTVSPYAKEQLRSYIEDTLGVSKENQKWI